jgi:hypothetical protein
MPDAIKIGHRKPHTQAGCYICKLPIGECLGHFNIQPGMMPPGAIGSFYGSDPRPKFLRTATERSRDMTAAPRVKS